MAASRVATDLAKDDLIRQWEEYCERKQTFLDGLNEYAKYCGEMNPKMTLCNYLEKIVGKSPNEAKEKEWKKGVGLTDQDCISSRSSRASSRSSVSGIGGLTPAKRRQVVHQLAMSVDPSYPYYAEMQPSFQHPVAPPPDVTKALEKIMGKLDDLGVAMQSLNGRVNDLESL